MRTKLYVKDKVIVMDSDFITVRARKTARKKLFKEPTVLVEDKVILEKYEKEFKETPPTQIKIFECFLSLVKPADDQTDEPFFEELCRLGCKWEKEVPGAATEYTEVTEAEFQELPYDIAKYVLDNLFTEDEKSFLAPPPGTDLCIIAEMTLIPVDRQMDLPITEIVELLEWSLSYAFNQKGWTKKE